MKREVAVIGLGGVGGYFGFKLNEANRQAEYDITFLARGATYDIVKRQGLTLLSPEHARSVTQPDRVIQKIAELNHPDLILICVKEYDLENVCQQLLGSVTENTILLPLMNGVDIYDRIRGIIQKGVVLPACVYVASHIKEKGVVEHKGKTGKIIFGPDHLRKEPPIDWVLELLQKSGAEVTFMDNPSAEIWTKFIFIAPFGLVTARYNQSIGQVCQNEVLKSRAASIMEEVKEIASLKQIGLPDNIIERTFQKAETFPFHTPTSLQLDIHSQKSNNELELFAGAIVRYGSELGVPVPQTEAIYNEIRQLLVNKAADRKVGL
jgi:2-dehydropantoate 2-reductase